MLLDLSRVRNKTIHPAAAGHGFGPSLTEGNKQRDRDGSIGEAFANYARNSSAVFAQSFVDRWAAGKSPMRGGDELPGQQHQMHRQGGSRTMSESEHRMMRMMVGGDNNSTKSSGAWLSSGRHQQQQHCQQQHQQHQVCNYCRNRLFKSLHELQSHEINCREMYNNNHMMNPIQQQLNSSFMRCLPVGTSVSSSAAGITSDGVKSQKPQLPPFLSSSDTAIAGSKERNTSKRRPPLRKEDDPELIQNSQGPFKTLDKPILLALDGDEDWLTPLHCFVRKHCVEVFTAADGDTSKTTAKGKRKPIVLGQIGIRCPHCNKKNDDTPNRGSTYYPNSIGHVYNATMNLLHRHLFFCSNMPPELLKKYAILKKDDARSGTSKTYWMESAKSLGFVDTLSGIKLSAKPAPPPPVRSSQQNETAENRKRSRNERNSDNKDEENNKGLSFKDVEDDISPLVLPDDKITATKYSFLLLSQMRRCVFTEADRLGKRKGLPSGFAGLACRHCIESYGSGRFFPASIKTLSDTSKTLDVINNHMVRCSNIPTTIVAELGILRQSHDIERAEMKFGSQKGELKRWSSVTQ
jgi:hypothetical protein